MDELVLRDVLLEAAVFAKGVELLRGRAVERVEVYLPGSGH